MELHIRSTMRSISQVLTSKERLQGYHLLKTTRVLPQLRRAIEKIHEGSYGICDDCEEKISEERLNVIKGATRCTTCQEIFEKKL